MMKFFTSDLRRNIIKILCLSIGLAVGFLLVAKIYFEQSYDSFFPDIDRIYRITESTVQNGEYKEHPNTPGGSAPELQRHIPQIEKATRFTTLTNGDPVLKLEDGRKIGVADVTLADTCCFDVLKTPILEGDPHEVLAVEDLVMIPRSKIPIRSAMAFSMRQPPYFSPRRVECFRWGWGFIEDSAPPHRKCSTRRKVIFTIFRCNMKKKKKGRPKSPGN